MNLFFQPQISQGIWHLDPDESRHVIRVLRKKQGDQIRLTDGKGFFYDAIITDPDARRCAFEVREKSTAAIRNFYIHIAISPTKNTDRVEWFVEKSVEFGIDEITPIQCDHSERQHLRIERLEKIAVVAMKQSLKARVPRINPLTDFKNIVQDANAIEKYIAHVDEKNPNQLRDTAKRNSSYLVLIGPEGDFSEEELKLAASWGFKKIGLGPSRLRTETAGIAACHLLNLANTA